MAKYQDGTAPAGSEVLTINSVEYPCNNFETSDGSNVVNHTDENGEHDGAVAFKGPTTGSAELQLAASDTVVPTTAAASATTGVFTIGSTTYFITSVSKPKPAGGFWTVSIQFQKRANAVV